MNQRLLDKLNRRAQSRGYALYYPNAAPSGAEVDDDSWLGIGYSEPQYNEKTGKETGSDRFYLALLDTKDPQLVEAVIHSLPKVKNAKTCNN